MEINNIIEGEILGILSQLCTSSVTSPKYM